MKPGIDIIIVLLPIVLLIGMLVISEIVKLKNKPLKTIVNKVCGDLYHKEIAFKCKCGKCKKPYIVYELEVIEMYITIVDSQCPYCNTINSSKVSCSSLETLSS